MTKAVRRSTIALLSFESRLRVVTGLESPDYVSVLGSLQAALVEKGKGRKEN
jgi:hypothetical protein